MSNCVFPSGVQVFDAEIPQGVLVKNMYPQQGGCNVKDNPVCNVHDHSVWAQYINLWYRYWKGKLSLTSLLVKMFSIVLISMQFDVIYNYTVIVYILNKS